MRRFKRQHALRYNWNGFYAMTVIELGPGQRVLAAELTQKTTINSSLT